MNDFIITLENYISQNELEFKPTQNKLSIPLIFRIYKKMKANLEFDAIKTCEGLIIDGHHRYIASKIADAKIENFPSSKNLTQLQYEWRDISLITSEYDSEADIKYHNYNDALRNGKTVIEIERLLIG